MATVSALATTLFLGGWMAPWPISIWDGANSGYWPVLWFFAKVLFFIFIFIWLRGSLPRLRYDQFMAFGWKRLIPISLAWIIAVAVIRTLSLEGDFNRSYIYAAFGVLAVLILVLGFADDRVTKARVKVEEEQARAEAEKPFDAYAGGYPVPPMPGPAVAGAGVVPVPAAKRNITMEEN